MNYDKESILSNIKYYESQIETNKSMLQALKDNYYAICNQESYRLFSKKFTNIVDLMLELNLNIQEVMKKNNI